MDIADDRAHIDCIPKTDDQAEAQEQIGRTDTEIGDFVAVRPAHRDDLVVVDGLCRLALLALGATEPRQALVALFASRALIAGVAFLAFRSTLPPIARRALIASVASLATWTALPLGALRTRLAPIAFLARLSPRSLVTPSPRMPSIACLSATFDGTSLR